jgi:hypothetical protein
VAVAVGPYIVLYRNLMAYFKFELPSLPVGVRTARPAGRLWSISPIARAQPLEAAAWEGLRQGTLGVDGCFKALNEAHDTGTQPAPATQCR